MCSMVSERRDWIFCQAGWEAYLYTCSDHVCSSDVKLFHPRMQTPNRFT